MLKLNTNCSVCNDKTNTINDENQKAFDDLVYKKDSELTIDINSDDVSITINSGKPIKFKKGNELGSGSFGSVFKLTSAEPEESPYHNIAAALKIEKNEVATEQEISEFLLENDCNTLKVKYIKTDKNEKNTRYNLHYYIMELANGDLTNLYSFYSENCGNSIDDNSDHKYTSETVKLYRDIVEEIRKQVACLLLKSNYKYVYNDLKFENILFSCSKDNTNIKVMLGDLGSTYVYGKYGFVHTYMPIEYYHKFKENKKYTETETEEEKKQKKLSWLIGILLLNFSDKDYCEIYKSEKLDEDDGYVNYIIKKSDNLILPTITRIFGEGFSSYLNINPRERTDIFKELPEISVKSEITPVNSKSSMKFSKKKSISSIKQKKQSKKNLRIRKNVNTQRNL